MIKKPTLISSSCDIASINIKNNILFIEAKNINEIILENELTINKIKNIYDSKNFRLIELNEENIYQDLLDEQLNFIGLPASYIVFLSRHSSKSKIKSLTVHSTGNYGGVFYGGNNYNELSIPYPIMMSKILNELYVLNEQYSLNCDVTLEITHHGPTKLKIPFFFVEIGSTKTDWNNTLLGYIVALSILKIVNLDEQSIIDNTKIAVGFGGNHYAHMPTKLTLKNSLYFGHIFPKYQIKNLTKDKINESFRKSNTKYAYIDKKSISSIHKKNLIQIIEDLGYFIISHEDLL